MRDGTHLAIVSSPAMSTGSFQFPRDVEPLSPATTDATALRASLAPHVALTALTLSAVYVIGPGLGFVVTVRAALMLALGAIAVQIAPGRAWELAAIFGAFQ